MFAPVGSELIYMSFVCPIRDPLAKYPDVHPMPIIGPSLIFNGQPARWTGNVCAEKSAGIEARIAFEAYTTRRVTSFLEIVNDGTTAIYFDWVVSNFTI